MQHMEATSKCPQQTQKLNNKPTTKNIAANLVDSVVNHMQADICQGVILIPNHKTDFVIEKKIKVIENQNNSQQKLAEVMERKEQIMKQLQTIKQEQVEIRNNKANLSRVTSSNNYYKSSFTNEDLQTIKKLKAQQKKFEKQLIEKTKQYEQRIKQIKQEEQQAKQQARKQKYDLKKQQISKTLELIQKRKNQRLSKIQQESKNVKQIIHRKKLHQQWEQKWKQVEEDQQKKKLQMKQEMRKLRKISHQQIKQHQKKYQDTIRIQRESRMKLFMPTNLEGANSYRSVFLEQIKEEQKKIKQAEQVRKNQPKQFLTRLKQYGDKVKTYHKPVVKAKEEGQQIQTQPQSQSPQVRSMSLFQTYKKGTEYMRAANMQIALKRKDQNIVKKQQPKSPRYKNYLSQLKKADPQHGKKTSQLYQIRQILNKENLSQQQKLYKAKILTQKIEHTQVVRTPQAMVNSINAKIQILKKINI